MTEVSTTVTPQACSGNLAKQVIYAEARVHGAIWLKALLTGAGVSEVSDIPYSRLEEIALELAMSREAFQVL